MSSGHERRRRGTPGTGNFKRQPEATRKRSRGIIRPERRFLNLRDIFRRSTAVQSMRDSSLVVRSAARASLKRANGNQTPKKMRNKQKERFPRTNASPHKERVHYSSPTEPPCPGVLWEDWGWAAVQEIESCLARLA